MIKPVVPAYQLVTALPVCVVVIQVPVGNSVQ